MTRMKNNYRNVLRLIIIGTILSLLYCIRDNPMDSKGTTFIPGKKPHAHFTADTLTGYLYDSLSISVVWSDTGIGGARGSVRMFYFGWDSSSKISDSIPGTDSSMFSFKKALPPGIRTLYMTAMDNDSNLSDIDSIKIIVLSSRPHITSISAPTAIQKSTPFTMVISAVDTGATIETFSWAVNGRTFDNSSPDSAINFSFDEVGLKTILVKALDSKGIESPIDSVRILVFDTPDTAGPVVLFVVPQNNDTLGQGSAEIYVTAVDQSSVTTILVNGKPFQQADAVWKGSVDLTLGKNTLTAVATDMIGNSSRTTIVVWYTLNPVDRTPPVILPKVPPHFKDTVNTGTLTIKVKAIDESGVAAISLDDNQMEKDAVDSTFYYSVVLVEGTNIYIIKSYDKKGNIGLDTLTVSYIPSLYDIVPPVVTINDPSANKHIADTVVIVKGTATDASRLGSLTVNDVSAIQKYPDWSAKIPLQYGRNVIRVIAVDSSVNRNRSFDSVSVIRNFPPRFTIAGNRLDSILPIDAAYRVTVRANDPDADSLQFRLLGSIFHSAGLPTIGQQGDSITVSYQPTSAGTDTFAIEVKDIWNDADTIKWRIFISNPLDSAPIFTTSIASLPDTVTARGVYTAIVKAVDPNGKPVTYLPGAGSPASLTVDGAGKITWSPAESDTGSRLVSVIATNGRQSDTLSWNIRVLVNDWPPVLTNPGPQTIDEMKTLRLSLTASDRNRDPLEFTFGSKFPSGARLDSNVFSWTPGYAAAGTYTTVIVVKERNRVPALVDSQSFTITVNNVNVAPVLANPGNKIAVANQTMSISLTATDFDNNTLTYSMANAPSGASLAGNIFSWTPTYAQGGAAYTVTFYVKDNGIPQQSDTAMVTITVSLLNAPPVLTNPGNKTVNEGQFLQFDLSASDPNNDSILYSMSQVPAGATLAGKRFSWTPLFTQAGTYRITFYAKDNVSPPLVDSQTITITVNNVNVKPVLSNPGNKTVNENQLLQFTLSATSPDGDEVSYEMANGPTGAALSGNVFRWTPTYFQAGTYSVKFYARDNGTPVLSDSQTISITVNNVNAPPVLTNPGNKTVDENVHLTFNLSATDVNGDALTYSMAAGPDQWAAIFGNQFHWTPTYTESGRYTVKFYVRDNGTPVMSDSQTITITVNNVNVAPALVNPGNKTVNENQQIAFALSASDTNGDVLTYFMSGGPAGAAITGNQFIWTPTYTQSGTYTVKFYVRDNGTPVLSDSQTISITVNNVNVAPVLVNPGNKTVNENQQLSFALSASDVNRDALTYSMSGGPIGAAVTGNQFIWTPTYTQSGTYTVKFYVRDNGTPVMADSQTIFITVNNVNVAPVLANPGNKTLNENQLLSLTLSATDGNADALTYSMSGGPAGAAVTANQFTWTPTYNQAGTYSIKFFARDNGTPIMSDSQTITITVNNVNRSPVIATIGNKSTGESQTLSFTVSASDPDGTTPSLSASPLPAGALFTPSTGVFSWTPSFDQSGSYSVKFKATDGPLSDSQTITITVGQTNRPPVLSTIGNKSIGESQTLSFTVSASDPDGTTPSLSAAPLPANANFNPATGVFSWTPSVGQSSSSPYSITFTASDGSLSDSKTISITVSAANQAPVLGTIVNHSITEGQALTFTVSASDPDGTTPSLSAAPLPANANFNPATGVFSWTPSVGQSSSSPYSITFTASDGSLSDSKSITITVSGVNVAPVLTNPGNKSINENAPLSFTLLATDANGDILTYSMTGGPSGSTLTGNQFNWTPGYTQAGSYPVTFKASDGSLSDSQTITITVIKVKVAPVLVKPNDTIIIANQNLSFTLSATDANGDSLTYSMTSVPDIGSRLTGNLFNWTPETSQASTVTFTVTDIDGLTGSKTMLITVNATGP